MDSKGIENFLEILYNYWNTSIDKMYPYKYNLGKVKCLFFLDNVFHDGQHNKQT